MDDGEKPVRNLATVLVELSEAQARNAERDKAWQRAEGDQGTQDAIGDASAAEDDTIDALKREARTMVEDRTGVPWSAIERAEL